MIIEKALFLYLKDVTGLTDRIYPSIMPQNTKYPACVLNKVSVNIFSSSVSGNYGMLSTVYQLYFYDIDYASANQMSKTIIAALNNFSGNMNGLDIQLALIKNESEDYDDKTKLYETTIEVEFFYTE